jgi:hypothetical protein
VNEPMSRVRVQKHLPMLLLGLLMLLLAGFVLTQADVHGRTYDEPLQDKYGHRVLDWYTSGGSDTSFMDFGKAQQMPQHGPLVETVIAGAQEVGAKSVDADPWMVRSVVGGFIGILGILLIALCGVELGGWWLGLTAAVGLTLYPRYTGAIFNNTKDVALAASMILVMWLVLRLMRRWTDRAPKLWIDYVLVGLALGAAMSVRVNAVLWYGIIGLIGFVWLLRRMRATPDRGLWKRDLKRVVLAGLVIGVVSYAAMLAFWPYIFLNPVSGLPDAYSSLSQYQWKHSILFEGQMVRAMELPRDYALVWLWQGSPWATVLLAIAGVVLVGYRFVRRQFNPAELVVLAAALLPLAAIVLLRPTLYNGLRHFLFIVPPLVLLGAFALVSLVKAVANRRAVAAVVIVAAVLTQVQVVVGISRIYPYEYMYFNQATGGFEAQHKEFEGDYWEACSREAAVWLNANWRDYTSNPTATVRNRPAPTALLEPYIGGGLKGVPKIEDADFGVEMVRPGRPGPWPTYRKIHNVVVDGVTICRVAASPRLS